MQPKAVVVSIVTLLFAATAMAQANWQTLTSSNGEFSVTVPTAYMVYNNKRSNAVSVFGSGDGAYFDLTFRKTGDADELIDALQKSSSDRATQSEFEVGDAKVYTYRLKDDNAFGYSVHVATRKGYYRVMTSSKSDDNNTLASILASIRLNNQQLIKDANGQPPVAASTTKVNSLRSSDLVRTALQRKQFGRIEVVDGVDKPLRERGVVYSRGLIILEKPVGRYTEEARRDGVKGAVRLRVLLKGDGTIGRITVVQGLPSGLTEQAIQAASLIKFLPAEVLGVPVDREVTVEYTFTYF